MKRRGGLGFGTKVEKIEGKSRGDDEGLDFGMEVKSEENKKR